MIGSIRFENLTPGTITNFYNGKRIFFNTQTVSMKNSTLNSVELVQLTAEGKPYYQFVFKKEYTRSVFETMVEIIEERLKTAGLTVDKDFAPSNCKDVIGFSKTSATDVNLRYLMG
uniref:KTSC domain-containing protein n=1 Tax=Panagrellus redivivus TaxID=6233 RepID=A0A7E4VNQ7_PANRE